MQSSVQSHSVTPFGRGSSFQGAVGIGDKPSAGMKERRPVAKAVGGSGMAEAPTAASTSTNGKPRIDVSPDRWIEGEGLEEAHFELRSALHRFVEFLFLRLGWCFTALEVR